MHATWWCKYFVFVVKKSLDEYVCGLTVFIVKDHLLFLLLLKTPLRSTSGFYIVKIKNRKNKSLALIVCLGNRLYPCCNILYFDNFKFSAIGSFPFFSVCHI